MDIPPNHRAGGSKKISRSLFTNKKSFSFAKRSLKPASRPTSGREASRPASGREASLSLYFFSRDNESAENESKLKQVPPIKPTHVRSPTLSLSLSLCFLLHFFLEFIFQKLFEIQTFFKYKIYSSYSCVCI
jgi:hypothetical protein